MCKLFGPVQQDASSMAFYVGTSGFSYKEWKGHFYPEDLPDRDWLSFYASKLTSVEINNTFYRMPRRSVLEHWAQDTPSQFRFVIKASRRITHQKRLKDADEPMAYLFKNVQALGDRLGAVLFQLPPNMRLDIGRLDKFLALVPLDVPIALEVRHPSWCDETVFQKLRSRNIALVRADGEGDELNIEDTADWCYLRLRRQR